MSSASLLRIVGRRHLAAAPGRGMLGACTGQFSDWEAGTMAATEPVPGDWEMVSESQKHTKGDAHAAVWLANVPAQGKATLDYSVRMRW